MSSISPPASSLAESPLWTPSPQRIAEAQLTGFLQYLKQTAGVEIGDYEQLRDWSIDNLETFWTAIWDYCGLIGERPSGTPVLVEGDKMPGAQFFPEARLNFAENLLRRSDDGDALVFWAEDKVKRRVSWHELQALVSRLQQLLKDQGVGQGDRVAGFMPNMPETVAAMLATTSLGAIWSSCSPDFGVQGVLDRFGQIEPKVLFVPDGYFYNGKEIDTLPKVREFLPQLPSVVKTVVCPLLGRPQAASELPGAVTLDDALKPYEARAIDYVRVPFNAPLYVMYSSGTTGKPKCIVHGVGGTLIQQVKEHRLNADVRSGDRVFYFTTCGWMMWNWLVASLACEATLLLYDGSPFAPNGNILFDYADAEGMTLFGTSAKYIDACNKAELAPRETHDLATVRTICSTGSPLVPEGFDYVYRSIKPDVSLASISGGTDILACFVLGNPIGPVHRGEIQARGLGMAVEVWDDEGKAVREQKGELVCVRPFPSMPLRFWGDSDGTRYRAAYFERFPGVWCHGDFVELTRHDGVIVYGRSDATLNPGGVRIGTAEIYRQVEKLPEVVESIVIGQDWQGDVRVVLFVRLREGGLLDEALEKRIKQTIRDGATPRHVPAKIVQVTDIPRTKSGKIVELAVRDLVHGRTVKNREALANPEALELYRDIEVLQQ
ncbi:acsA2 [Symbiodinium necroappetens]|uniref:AcsA2 protein n=1 Tax=Symbiodinium necroappetens TaxID=1628268 RepID=A0A813B6U7_9DINO|nr:acsA2 [Symbiodinium necroappetens]